MFREICGDKYIRNVTLLTTMWDRVGSMEGGERRETILKERFWNVMIHHGVTVGRFHLGERYGSKSPWIILDKMIQRHQPGQALLLQEELVDLGKRFNETSAGKLLSKNLQNLLNRMNGEIKSIEEMEGGRMDADLRAEIEALRMQYENIRKAKIGMEIPAGTEVDLVIGKPIDIAIGKSTGIAIGKPKRRKGKAVSIGLLFYSNFQLTVRFSFTSFQYCSSR
jgi:hypothetical protein